MSKKKGSKWTMRTHLLRIAAACSLQYYCHLTITLFWLHHTRESVLWRSSCCTYLLVAAQKQVLECIFEGGVAEGVAGWVDGAVDVAEPVADGPQGVRDADGAEGVDQDHHVVRCPRDNKSDQDGHDGARHLLLPGWNALPLPLCHSTTLLSYLENEIQRRKTLFHLVLSYFKNLYWTLIPIDHTTTFWSQIGLRSAAGNHHVGAL